MAGRFPKLKMCPEFEIFKIAGCYTNMAALEADIKLLVSNAKVSE